MTLSIRCDTRGVLIGYRNPHNAGGHKEAGSVGGQNKAGVYRKREKGLCEVEEASYFFVGAGLGALITSHQLTNDNDNRMTVDNKHNNDKGKITK